MNVTTPHTRPAADVKADAFDVEAVRAQFPILQTRVHDKPLVYLDNAATAQKPQTVIDAVSDYYRTTNANVHRGLHALAEQATAAYEQTRADAASFLNARSSSEIVFVRGATEGMNLIAASFGRANLRPGDEVLISHMEHHSGVVPWQLACEATGATLRVAPIDDHGQLILDDLENLITDRTKIVSILHVSNALGTINPVHRIIELAKAAGAVTVIDGAQAAPHLPIDVQGLGCDFYTLSAHKMYGPTGVGVLYGRAELLDRMPPYQGGGEMIDTVTFEKTTYNEIPWKFEAGTPNIAGVVAFSAAIDFVRSLDAAALAAHENDLLAYATESLRRIDGLRIIGDAAHKTAVISFVLDDVHAHDLGTIIDRYAVAVRTGHHCAQPVMDRFNVPATTRASFAAYNTRREADALVEAILKARKMFA